MGEGGTLVELFRVSRGFIRELPQLLSFAFRVVWGAARASLIGWCVLLLIRGGLPGVLVSLTRNVIDQVDLAISAQGLAGSNVVFWVGVLGSVIVIDLVCRGLSKVLRSVIGEAARDQVRWIIHGKAISLDLSQFQSTDYYNRWYRALWQAQSRPTALLESLGAIVQSMIAVGGISVVLMQYEWWLPLALGGSLVPMLVVTMHQGRQFNQWRRAITPRERRRAHLDQMLTMPEAAPEVRLLNLGSRFRLRSREMSDAIRNERLALFWRQALGTLLAALVGLGVLGYLMFQAIASAMVGVFSLGDLGLFYAALNQGLLAMRRGVQGLSQVYQNAMFVGDLAEFLELQPSIESGEQDLDSVRESLELRRVSFSYREGSEPVLTSFDLKLEVGKTTALVGDNGAGKSTITKLLTRLHDVDVGTVLIDGVDVKNFSLRSLRRLFSVMPQEPVRFQESLADNIRLAGRPGLDDDRSIEEAAAFAGVDQFSRKLANGLDTHLGYRFGETELSGGQWQRVALARVHYRNAPVIILDEPTSHMDSWAEAHWLDRLQELARGRTVLLITHRFTTAMRADLIHVMKAGQIVESGSHRELISNGGHYASSWGKQMNED